MSRTTTLFLESAFLTFNLGGLDPPFVLYFTRLVKRTFLRLFRLAPPCAPGCLEQPSEAFFSRDSIFWWAITNHRRVRKMLEKRMMEDDASRGGRMRRIGGWGKELSTWKEEVKRIARRREAEGS